jgi:hypothetical protein
VAGHENPSGSDEDRSEDRSEDAGKAMVSFHQRFGPMIGPFGMAGQSARRCSFCDRREDAVSKLVRARGSYICDRCVRLAVAAIDDPANDRALLRIKPRPVFPSDRVAAEEAIEWAYETVFGGGSDVERCQAIERGANLLPTMRQVQERAPGVHVDVSVEYIRFIDDTEAEVSFVLILPGQNQVPGMHMPSKGYAALDEGVWKVARATYSELIARIGVTCPPPD